jgi:hypothetical protein
MPAPTFAERSASLARHETFVVFAETLDGWRSPENPRGREVLERHYQWAAGHRASGTTSTTRRRRRGGSIGSCRA